MVGPMAKRYIERSLPVFQNTFDIKEACLLNRLGAIRWPDGIICPRGRYDKALYTQVRCATGSTAASGRELLDLLMCA